MTRRRFHGKWVHIPASSSAPVLMSSVISSSFMRMLIASSRIFCCACTSLHSESFPDRRSQEQSSDSRFPQTSGTQIPRSGKPNLSRQVTEGQSDLGSVAGVWHSIAQNHLKLPPKHTPLPDPMSSSFSLTKAAGLYFCFSFVLWAPSRWDIKITQ